MVASSRQPSDRVTPADIYFYFRDFFTVFTTLLFFFFLSSHNTPGEASVATKTTCTLGPENAVLTHAKSVRGLDTLRSRTSLLPLDTLSSGATSVFLIALFNSGRVVRESPVYSQPVALPIIEPPKSEREG